MKRILTILIIALPNFFAFAQGESSVIGTSTYFEFHSDYWINLHHFLYQKAQGSQERKLVNNGMSFLDIGEEEIYTRLSVSESAQLESAIRFYKDSVISRNLLRELGFQRVWLQDQKGTELENATDISPNLVSELNSISKVYRTHFWPVHNKHNESIIKQQMQQVRQLESAVVTKMEKLSKNPWPSDSKVRVDLTAYANWAGAYTPTRPRFNIFISTLDPSCLTTSFVETVFHEGSHLLYRFGSPFRSAVVNTCEELGVAVPQGLWHACMFYLCGITVQSVLAKSGITHELVMDSRKIFSNYNTPQFRNTLDQYYKGDMSLDTVIKALISGEN